MNYNVCGSYSHLLVTKLKSLKQDLKTWNKEIFWNVTIKKEMKC